MNVGNSLCELDKLGFSIRKLMEKAKAKGVKLTAYR